MKLDGPQSYEWASYVILREAIKAIKSADETIKLKNETFLDTK